MKTELFIKNPILFALSNNYEAQTPHIKRVVETLNQAATERSFYPDGYPRDVWKDIKDLKIEISAFGLNYVWNTVDDDGNTYEDNANYEWLDSYEYLFSSAELDNEYLDDESMKELSLDAKGLQIAIQISNM